MSEEGHEVHYLVSFKLHLFELGQFFLSYILQGEYGPRWDICICYFHIHIFRTELSTRIYEMTFNGCDTALLL